MLHMLPYRYTPKMSPAEDSFSMMTDDFFCKVFRFPMPQASLRVDVEEREDAYQICADLPGVRKEEIEVTMQEGILTIQATLRQKEEHTDGQYLCRERCRGVVQRSFRLENVREEDITAEYREGVLTLRIPKMDSQSPGSRKIEIN